MGSIYIDDVAALCFVPWRDLGRVQTGCSKLAKKTDCCYAELGLLRSVQKDQDDAKDGTLWGLALEGNRGTVGMDRGKRMALAYITLKAAHMPIS